MTINSNTGNCLLAIHYGDGDLDILTTGYGYGLRVFTNNGNRSFTPDSNTQYPADRFLLAEDFNGDNAADLILSDNAEAIRVAERWHRQLR